MVTLSPGPARENRMDLLLWRHAEALNGSPDHERPLSERGIRQARETAAWLTRHAPRNLRILVSPSLRTRQTAAIFSENFTTVPELGPEAGAANLLAAAGWPDAGGAALIVGHQPALGRAASLLLAGSEAEWTFRKSAVWWFSSRIRNGQRQTILRAVTGAGLT